MGGDDEWWLLLSRQGCDYVVIRLPPGLKRMEFHRQTERAELRAEVSLDVQEVVWRRKGMPFADQRF